MTLLTRSEQDQVAAAINAVERETDAEMVTVLARQADNYAYIPLVWAGIVALLVPGLVNYFTEWFGVHTLLLVQWGVFLVLGVLFRIPTINTMLIPRHVRYWRAANLARRHFLEQNLHHTRDSTGVLIFVSEAERYVEILVDRGVSARVDNQVWEGIVDNFTRQVREGNTCQGFLDCIEACGAHLKEHIPATHERNQLPNHLVVLE